MTEVGVGYVLEEYGRRLRLQLLAGKDGLWRKMNTTEIHRAGLALTGFIDLYTYDRIQVIGNTEMLYLSKVSEYDRSEALKTIYQFDLPCIVLTDNNDPLPLMIELADQTDIPLLKTTLGTTKFGHLFNFYVDDLLAPQTTRHGSLVDVYGVGLFFTGRSGIGKSEIALDLVERGHRLVADDIITVTRKAQGILVGSCDPTLSHFMEIRGVGLIDIRSMFGIRGIRLQKRIEVEVQLVDWSKDLQYERTGIDDKATTILDIEVPVVTVPVYPGKNVTVISESIALNYVEKIHGYHSAREFDKRLIKKMEKEREEKPEEEAIAARKDLE